MELREGERILVLGGSRGLGAALMQALEARKTNPMSYSRKSAVSFDFSQTESWPKIYDRIRSLNPQRIIYCAGGGPYGSFQKFQWKDHSWAFKVTFEFPASLLHFLLQNGKTDLEQLILIGSSIAESQPDPGAASYAAAKHALRGLVTSVQKEELPFDLRLLSPGYMETDLLPYDSAPRRAGLAKSPQQVAQLMIQSISDPALRMQNQSFD